MTSPTLAQWRAGLLSATLREVNGAKDSILEGQATLERIIREADPQNGLGVALAEAERKAKDLANELENIATGHLGGTKE